MPDFLRVGVALSLALMYDGNVYDDFPGTCQHCGSGACKKLGFEESVLARLIGKKDGKLIPITVYKQRHYCKRCGRTYMAKGPFYPGTEYGTPMVDLALALATENSAYGTERVLTNMGLQLDRATILDYVRLFAKRAKELAPLIEGQGEKLYAINMLKILFGVNNVEELKRKLPDVSAESLSDEAYLRKKGALKEILEEISEGKKKRLVHRGTKGDIVVEEGRDGKERASFPRSFTLALSYLPGAEAYASLICTPGPFNQILADILFKALEGASFNMTDGSLNYEEVENHVLDPVHRTRTELRHDPRFSELKKELRTEKEKVDKAKGRGEKEKAIERLESKVTEVSDYAKAKYQDVLKSTIDQLKKEHPELFDEKGNFMGRALTSNGMEGGNFRLKYAVRVPYFKECSAAGRSILAAIKDSVFSVRGGDARESLANAVGCFRFSNVMMSAV